VYRPRVPYDYSKVIAENLAESYYRTKGLPVSITRSWLLFGENDLPYRAVMRFVDACLRNKPIKLYNSGRDTTAPTHATNYGELVRLILENDQAVGEPFNFSGERIVSIKELARIIKTLTKSRSEVLLLPPRSELEKKPQISYPTLQRVKKILHYKPVVNLEQGLQRTIDWVRTGALTR
jgi:nucleoside-diphosphate-sugar epimerase